MNGYELPSAPELYQRYRHRTKKRFGQHFLTNPAILEQIVGHAGMCKDVGEGVQVLEIGPGCGTLTTTLMQHRASVTAIEIDSDAADFLEEELVPHGLRLIRGDALAIDFSELFPKDGERLVVANLPYNVATPLTTRLLESRQFSRMVLMYQKEVANRICARSRSSAYGSLTVAVAWRARAREMMKLGGGAFTPPPKVVSSVVLFECEKLNRYNKEAQEWEEITEERMQALESVVKCGFQQRRKTLLNTLSCRFPKKDVTRALERLGFSSSSRAEELSPQNWFNFATLLTQSE